MLSFSCEGDEIEVGGHEKASGFVCCVSVESSSVVLTQHHDLVRSRISSEWSLHGEAKRTCTCTIWRIRTFNTAPNRPPSLNRHITVAATEPCDCAALLHIPQSNNDQYAGVR